MMNQLMDKYSRELIDISIRLPEFSVTTLNNGIRLYLMPTNDSPLTSIYLLIKKGAMDEASEKYGLAQLTAGMLKKGAGNLNSEQINFKTDFYGISFQVFAHSDYTGIEAEVLNEFIDPAWEVVYSSVSAPHFAKDELEKYKSIRLDSLKKIEENPSHVSIKGLMQLLFDRRYYGRPLEGTTTSIELTTVEDIRAFYHQSYRPHDMVLFLTGNIDDSFVNKVTADLEKLPSDAGETPRNIPVFKNSPRIWIIDKPDATQVQVKIGWHICSHTSPDYYPLQMGSFVLGGSYSSRLMQEIRVNRGLSYGAYGRIQVFQKDVAAMFIDTFTRPENVNLLLEIIKNEIKKMSQTLIEESELHSQRNYISGQYPLSFETNSDLVNKLLRIELHYFTKEQIEQLPKLLKNCNPESIRRAFKKFIFWEQATMSLLGPAEIIRKQIPAEFQPYITIKTVSDIINLT